jgi:hypothetical protein
MGLVGMQRQRFAFLVLRVRANRGDPGAAHLVSEGREGDTSSRVADKVEFNNKSIVANIRCISSFKKCWERH